MHGPAGTSVGGSGAPVNARKLDSPELSDTEIDLTDVPTARTPNTASFARVLTEAKRGDGDAYAELFHLVAPRIRTFASARGATDPDGLTNEVLHRAFKNLQSFRGSEKAFAGWVFKIARNALIDEFRARSSRPDTVPLQSGDVAGSTTDVDDWVDVQGELGWINSLLGRLTEDQREVMLLRVMGGLSFNEIAVALDRRPGAVRSLYKRARTTLVTMVEAEGAPTRPA